MIRTTIRWLWRCRSCAWRSRRRPNGCFLHGSSIHCFFFFAQRKCKLRWTFLLTPHIENSYQQFLLTGSPLCIYDYVSVHDGRTESSRRIARLCGSVIPVSLQSSSSFVFVKFHSDTGRTYKGFLAKWQSTNVRVRTDPRPSSKATIDCVIVVRLVRRNGVTLWGTGNSSVFAIVPVPFGVKIGVPIWLCNNTFFSLLWKEITNNQDILKHNSWLSSHRYFLTKGPLKAWHIFPKLIKSWHSNALRIRICKIIFKSCEVFSPLLQDIL